MSKKKKKIEYQNNKDISMIVQLIQLYMKKLSLHQFIRYDIHTRGMMIIVTLEYHVNNGWFVDVPIVCLSDEAEIIFTVVHYMLC